MFDLQLLLDYGSNDERWVSLSTNLWTKDPVGLFQTVAEAENALLARKAKFPHNKYRIINEDPPVKPATDDLSAPPYYSRLKPEPIDVIRSWGLSHNLGAPITYIARAGHKPGVKASHDLKKAVVFLQREIEALEKEGK